MNNKHNQPEDKELAGLLKAARPAPDLPPGFNNSVWRRIESAEPSMDITPGPAWLDQLAALLVTPRLALATLAVLIVLGGGMGVMNGALHSKEILRDRYIVSVNPMELGK